MKSVLYLFLIKIVIVGLFSVEKRKNCVNLFQACKILIFDHSCRIVIHVPACAGTSITIHNGDCYNSHVI